MGFRIHLRQAIITLALDQACPGGLLLSALEVRPPEVSSENHYTTGGCIRACFLVPATEAVVATVVWKVLEKTQDHGETVRVRLDNGKTEMAEKLPFARKL